MPRTASLSCYFEKAKHVAKEFNKDSLGYMLYILLLFSTGANPVQVSIMPSDLGTTLKADNRARFQPPYIHTYHMCKRPWCGGT
jgi:hypothetical protein